MIINLTRKTTMEHHNPNRRIRLNKYGASNWADCKELTVRVKQGDSVTLWRSN